MDKNLITTTIGSKYLLLTKNSTTKFLVVISLVMSEEKTTITSMSAKTEKFDNKTEINILNFLLDTLVIFDI